MQGQNQKGQLAERGKADGADGSQTGKRRRKRRRRLRDKAALWGGKLSDVTQR